MSAVIFQISEAVAKALIDSGEFVLPVSISAKVLPLHKLTGLAGDVTVDVIPSAASSERLDRVSFAESYEVTVVVQKKVANEETEVPPLFELIEQIEQRLRNVLLSGASFKAVVVGSERNELYDVDLLHADKLFASALALKVKRLS